MKTLINVHQTKPEQWTGKVVRDDAELFRCYAATETLAHQRCAAWLRKNDIAATKGWEIVLEPGEEIHLGNNIVNPNIECVYRGFGVNRRAVTVITFFTNDDCSSFAQEI